MNFTDREVVPDGDVDGLEGHFAEIINFSTPKKESAFVSVEVKDYSDFERTTKLDLDRANYDALASAYGANSLGELMGESVVLIPGKNGWSYLMPYRDGLGQSS